MIIRPFKNRYTYKPVNLCLVIKYICLSVSSANTSKYCLLDECRLHVWCDPFSRPEIGKNRNPKILQTNSCIVYINNPFLETSAQYCILNNFHFKLFFNTLWISFSSIKHIYNISTTNFCITKTIERNVYKMQIFIFSKCSM